MNGEEIPIDEDVERPPWVSEFVNRVKRLLPALLGPGAFLKEPVPYDQVRADMLYVHKSGQVSVIEVAATLPSTRPRLEAVVAQLRAYGAELTTNSIGLLDHPNLVLVIAGVLSEENQRLIQRMGDIRVLDEDQLASVESPERPRRRHSHTDNLGRMLSSLPPGRKNGVQYRYQRLVRDILEYLLCPPLSGSLYESPDSQGHNRRDMIFPNYVDYGLWLHMRQTYEAHYIVVDAKNYSSRVKKDDVLQIANYLNRHGTGLFGIIATRFEDDPGSLRTRRDQWVINQKLLIVLNDQDLLQMLAMKEAGDDPAVLIRQKVEDFRIAM